MRAHVAIITTRQARVRNVTALHSPLLKNNRPSRNDPEFYPRVLLVDRRSSGTVCSGREFGCNAGDAAGGETGVVTTGFPAESGGAASVSELAHSASSSGDRERGKVVAR